MMTLRFLSRLKKSRSNIERLIDSTRDHSNKNNLEAAVRRCSSRQVFLRISQYSQRKHLFWSLFLITLQSSIETPIQVLSSEYCKILRNAFSYRTSLVAVSEAGRKAPAADDNKLITNNNLRYEQQQRATTNCRYKGVRQQK